MNNIEILEELINDYRNCGLDDFPDSVIDFGLNKSQIIALKNLIQENKKLKEIIFNIRRTLKGKIITKNGNIYAPAKNLSKQEVYQTFVDISLYLKANYIFEDVERVIQELLEEGE